MSEAWETILQETSLGKRLTPDEAALLYRSAPFRALGRAARRRRIERVDPGKVTYLIDRNINYTNVCITDCQFCAFYRPPGHDEAYTLSNEQIGRKIEETLAIGGTRILMQGGHHPDLPLTWYTDLLGWIRAHFPAIEIDAFSPSEIDHIASLERITILETLERLKEAGLAGLPGGGGEMLDDEVRRRVSPKKQDAAGWLEVMRRAQAIGLATTCTQVIGFGETLEQRIGHLSRLRDLQDESQAEHGNGFIAFIAWTLQTANTPLASSAQKRTYGATGGEYLRHVAVSRLFLDNVDHIQSSWPTQGERVARMALGFGADDFGSTMLEENVVSSAGTTRCSMSEAEICTQIRRAGFKPAQRDTRYQLINSEVQA
ncbi:MAG: dehypoxanthine futalosine cyclase [Planctomycetota bacterium]|nr:dehypoxanthine futalosine cyclase [Planctomycetota bacterium]